MTQLFLFSFWYLLALVVLFSRWFLLCLLFDVLFLLLRLVIVNENILLPVG